LPSQRGDDSRYTDTDADHLETGNSVWLQRKSYGHSQDASGPDELIYGYPVQTNDYVKLDSFHLNRNET
jgi:hypothetical protein